MLIAFICIRLLDDSNYIVKHESMHTWKSKSSDSSWEAGSWPGHITGKGRKKPRRPAPFPATGEAKWSRCSTEGEKKRAAAISFLMVWILVYYRLTSSLYLACNDETRLLMCWDGCYALCMYALMCSKFIGRGSARLLAASSCYVKWENVK